MKECLGLQKNAVFTESIVPRIVSSWFSLHIGYTISHSRFNFSELLFVNLQNLFSFHGNPSGCENLFIDSIDSVYKI